MVTQLQLNKKKKLLIHYFVETRVKNEQAWDESSHILYIIHIFVVYPHLIKSKLLGSKWVLYVIWLIFFLFSSTLNPTFSLSLSLFYVRIGLTAHVITPHYSLTLLTSGVWCVYITSEFGLEFRIIGFWVEGSNSHLGLDCDEKLEMDQCVQAYWRAKALIFFFLNHKLTQPRGKNV